jgi:hypothetical protein
MLKFFQHLSFLTTHRSWNEPDLHQAKVQDDDYGLWGKSED